jgi:MFS superfamily sulfate permease-like transporter
LIASILVLIVCLAIGPLFSTLPKACLAAIIVVALKNMLLQILQVPQLYKTSKLEAVR